MQQRSRFSDIKTHRWKIGKCHVATFTLFLFVAAAAATAIVITSFLWLNSNLSSQTMAITTKTNRNPSQETEISIDCTKILHQNRTQTGGSYPKPVITGKSQTEDNRTCPEYFKWIHEDLKPWRETGITREMVEKAKTTAHFRLVIVNGRVFVEKYKKSIQTRDVFTIWGILQLLRQYPGKLPDVELMFDCDDRPVIRSNGYKETESNRTVEKGPPVLFRYCGNRWTVDIVFPDWSFWGWEEINIKPWEKVLEEMEEGKKKKRWKEREAYAYWKGNPFVSAPSRQHLLTCNLTNLHDWNAILFIQDWILEGQRGFENSNVANQCTYRYKIYIEGYAWSVSEKYILACDSVTLMVKPYYYDFFTRSLQPLQHYWPINDIHKCKSIKFAVDWLNNNTQKAQEMGKAASEFMQRDVSMENVYNYMFHLLNEYSKLLRFKPEIPQNGGEVCSEEIICASEDNGPMGFDNGPMGFINGPKKKFMMGSYVNGPYNSGPCSLPLPFESKALERFYRQKLNLIRQVEKWEDAYWKRVQ